MRRILIPLPGNCMKAKFGKCLQGLAGKQPLLCQGSDPLQHSGGFYNPSETAWGTWLQRDSPLAGGGGSPPPDSWFRWRHLRLEGGEKRMLKGISLLVPPLRISMCQLSHMARRGQNPTGMFMSGSENSKNLGFFSPLPFQH